LQAEKDAIAKQKQEEEKARLVAEKRAKNQKQVAELVEMFKAMDENMKAMNDQTVWANYLDHKNKILESAATETPFTPDEQNTLIKTARLTASAASKKITGLQELESERIRELNKKLEEQAEKIKKQEEAMKTAVLENPQSNATRAIREIIDGFGNGTTTQQTAAKEERVTASAASSDWMASYANMAGLQAFSSNTGNGAEYQRVTASAKKDEDDETSAIAKQFPLIAPLVKNYAPLIDMWRNPTPVTDMPLTKGLLHEQQRNGVGNNTMTLRNGAVIQF
jgi:hypothetical protein